MRRPTLSPVQVPGLLEMLAMLPPEAPDTTKEIKQLRDTLLEKIGEVVAILQVAEQTLESVRTVRKGDPGETIEGPQGEPGEQGPPGESIVGPAGPKGDKGDSVVGPRGPQGEKGDSIVGPAGPRGKMGTSGKDAVLDYEMLVEEIILSQKLKPEHIAGLRETLEVIRREARSSGQMRGGGDTVVAGSGITITNTVNGNKEISAASSGANIATEAVTAVQSGSNVTIDLTQLANPFLAIQFPTRNGFIVQPGGDPGDGTSRWDRVGNSLTVYNADAGELYQVQYTYA